MTPTFGGRVSSYVLRYVRMSKMILSTQNISNYKGVMAAFAPPDAVWNQLGPGQMSNELATTIAFWRE